MFNRFVTAALVLSLAACAAPHRLTPAPRLAIPPTLSLQSLPAAGDYRIDSGNSELRLLVYRAGPLANLGHNHVMVNRAVTGAVHIGDSLSASSFSLSASVNDFVIDDPQSRLEEGSDFPGDIAPEAKAGTRRNMLSSAVLDAAEFPDITVKSVSLSGTLDAINAELEISAAGRTSKISLSFALQGDAQLFIAAGSLQLQQTALGLTPYSLMHGALQVQDGMQLKFKITVLRNQSKESASLPAPPTSRPASSAFPAAFHH